MLDSDYHTRRLIVTEHQAALRRDAQQPQRDRHAKRLLTRVAPSRSSIGRAERTWPWWRRRAQRRAAQAS